jgi:hypothetical protein
MSLEFVQDEDDKIWLVRSGECLVSFDKSSRRYVHSLARPAASAVYCALIPVLTVAFSGKRPAASPDQLKRSRMEAAVRSTSPAAASALTLPPEGLSLDAGLSVSSCGISAAGSPDGGRLSPLSRPASVGRHSEARISRRRMRAEAAGGFSPRHDESLSASGGGGGGSSTWDIGAFASLVGSSVAPASAASFGTSAFGEGFSSSSVVQQPEVPNARLGKEVPLLNGSTLSLGTSQLSGCQGDFCHIRMGSLQEPTLAGDRAFTRSLSKFRRRLVDGDVSSRSISGDEGEPWEDAAARDLIIGDAAVEASAQGSSRGKARRRAQGPAVAAATPASSSSSSALVQIPYRSIIQARQEMPLVKAFLLRRKNKEAGDYCTEDNFHDIAVGGKLPSVYYTEVHCCPNCAQVIPGPAAVHALPPARLSYVIPQVYRIIENARSKAMLKIQKKRDEDREKAPERLLVMQLDSLQRSSAATDSRRRSSPPQSKSARPQRQQQQQLGQAQPGDLHEEGSHFSVLTDDDFHSSASVGRPDWAAADEKSRSSLLAAAEVKRGRR